MLPNDPVAVSPTCAAVAVDVGPTALLLLLLLLLVSVAEPAAVLAWRLLPLVAAAAAARSLSSCKKLAQGQLDPARPWIASRTGNGGDSSHQKTRNIQPCSVLCLALPASLLVSIEARMQASQSMMEA